VSGVLQRMYALLDGREPERSLDLLAPDLRFSIVFSHGPGDAREFSGGRAEFDAYMAQRGGPTWTHHLLSQSSDGRLEIAFGETRQDGVPLATFVVAARLDDEGRIDRYIVGRSPGVMFSLRNT
jgi:hypothetical protein